MEHALTSKPLPDAQVLVLVPRAWLEDVTSKLDALLKTATRPVQSVGYLPQPAHYISRDDAAKITGYSTKTIGRLIGAGKLRSYGARGDRIRRSELDAVMADLPKQGESADEDKAFNEGLASVRGYDKPKIGG